MEMRPFFYKRECLRDRVLESKYLGWKVTSWGEDKIILLFGGEIYVCHGEFEGIKLFW